MIDQCGDDKEDGDVRDAAEHWSGARALAFLRVAAEHLSGALALCVA